MTFTILLIEDDPDVSDALSEVLRDERYGVVVVKNGFEGLEYLRSHEPPSIILLDLMMPVMDGYQFRAQQRREPAMADIPIIVISAGTMGQQVEGMAATAVLKKPLNLDVLLTAIQQHCQSGS